MVTTVDHSEISRDLVALFQCVRRDVVRKLRKSGVPLAIPITKYAIERIENGWRGSYGQVERNILAGSGLEVLRVAPLLTEATVSAIEEIAGRLASCPEVNLPYACFYLQAGWTLVEDLDSMLSGVPDFESEPKSWVVRQLLLPGLNYHLAQLDRLDRSSESVASSFAREVLSLAHDTVLRHKLSIPVSGIHIPGRVSKITASELTVRRLSPEEQAQVWQDEWGMTKPSVRAAMLPVPDSELVISVEAPRDSYIFDSRDIVTRWLCAFKLHGYSMGGATIRTQSEPAWRSNGTSISPVNLPSYPAGEFQVTQACLAKVEATARALKKLNLSQPKSTSDLALHRFFVGNTRTDAMDAVIDYTVALESLLLPYDDSVRYTELGYRFMVNGSHYLAASKAERDLVAKQLRELYGVRSRLVHGGGKYPKADEISACRTAAESLLCAGLLRAVHEGFPKAKEFRDVALGL